MEHFAGGGGGGDILLPRMKYTHEIVGTHGEALLPERAIGALVCIGLNSPVTFVISVLTPFSSFRRPVVY